MVSHIGLLLVPRCFCVVWLVTITLFHHTALMFCVKLGLLLCVQSQGKSVFAQTLTFASKP